MRRYLIPRSGWLPARRVRIHVGVERGGRRPVIRTQKRREQTDYDQQPIMSFQGFPGFGL